MRVFSHELIGDDPIAQRVFEFSEFVTRYGDLSRLSPSVRGRLIYHDSCHQLRALKAAEAPRSLLRSLKGIELVEFAEPACCGFGGTFSVKMPEISQVMATDKVTAIQQSGAEAVVSSDMGCLMQIAGGLKAAGSSVRTLHIAEVVSPA
jgi:L-lactate dehydrogenase complex protein LldE